MKNHEFHIPQATAKRLPLYFRFLKILHEAGKLRVSSKELERAVKVDSATIRRDLSYFGALGKKGFGYDIEALLRFFRKTLNQEGVTDVILVGVGNLGTALLRYNFMKNDNTRIVAAFDTKDNNIGTEIGGVPIHDVQTFNDYDFTNVKAAILTVPVTSAQSMSDQIVANGIEGILNFTPERLTVPDHIRVHHIDFAVELQTLLYFLRHFPLQ